VSPPSPSAWPPPEPLPPATGSSPDSELATRIMLLDEPFGSEPHVRERERAAQWLLDHGDRAHRALLDALAAGRASPGVIELLARFGRAESIEPLNRMLNAAGPAAWHAAQALARHPQPEAAEALRRALRDPAPEVSIAAADALGARGDPGECVALQAELRAEDPTVRYHVVQAAARLGCVSAEWLAQLARADPDADIQALAGRLAESG
jgi:HEAT repeat protein